MATKKFNDTCIQFESKTSYNFESDTTKVDDLRTVIYNKVNSIYALSQNAGFRINVTKHELDFENYYRSGVSVSFYTSHEYTNSEKTQIKNAILGFCGVVGGSVEIHIQQSYTITA